MSLPLDQLAYECPLNPAPSAVTVDRSDPLLVAKAFLAGIKAHSSETMRSLVHPSATACLIREGKPLHKQLMEIIDLVQRYHDNAEADEVSHEEVVHIDGDFACCWTPYKYYEYGKLHHTGTNNFAMWKEPEKGWLITAIQDNARPAEGVETVNVIGGERCVVVTPQVLQEQCLPGSYMFGKPGPAARIA